MYTASTSLNIHLNSSVSLTVNQNVFVKPIEELFLKFSIKLFKTSLFLVLLKAMLFIITIQNKNTFCFEIQRQKA